MYAVQRKTNNASPPQSHLGKAASPPLNTEWTRPLAVQCPLQMSLITQPPVRQVPHHADGHMTIAYTSIFSFGKYITGNAVYTSFLRCTLLSDQSRHLGKFATM